MATTPLQGSEPSVALYGSAACNRGGTGVYTSRLITGFALIGADNVVPVGGEPGNPLGRFFMENHTIPARVGRGDFDLQHLPAFGGRPFRGIPYAVTVHDMAFMANPGWFPFLRSIYYRLHFPGIARGASVVIADSDFTAAEIRKYLDRDSIRVYLSAPPNHSTGQRFRRRYGIDGPYVICTGTVEPRKNVNALLRSWQTVLRKRPGLELVMAGRWGWGDTATRKLLAGTDGVRWVGPLSSEDMLSATAGAELLVYPSLYEGFGLPPLEAAAAGVPFVIGPAATLAEIYGPVAAGVAGETPGSIAGAVLDSLESRADPDGLRDFAAGFSLETMARNTLECYRKVFH